MLDEVVGAVWTDGRHVQEVLVCVRVVCLSMLFVGRYVAKDTVAEYPGACRVGAREAGFDAAHDLFHDVLGGGELRALVRDVEQAGTSIDRRG